MISQITIKALKSISDITLCCSNLNLLIGTNSSGKSTALQSILLLSQNIDTQYGLNGPLVSLGDFRESKNFNVPDNAIELMLIDNKGSSIKMKITEDNGVNVEYANDHDLTYSMNYNHQTLHYLSCNRIGGQDIYQKNIFGLHKVGINGEYAIEYLMRHGSDELEQSLLRSKDSFTLLHQVNTWLKYIINANIKVEDITDTDVVKARFSHIEGKSIRPKNVGSGLSYIISILVLCLSSNCDDKIIIENPEIHLHPLSQSRLCEFFYFISLSGRQLFIETHSDHFFNGIRAGIATSSIDESKVTVNFFKLNDNNCSEVIPIHFGRKGKVLNQVKDLFDQFELDLNKMLGI